MSKQSREPSLEPEYKNFGPNFVEQDLKNMIIAASKYDEFLVEGSQWEADNYWKLLKDDYMGRSFTADEFDALALAARHELSATRQEINELTGPSSEGSDDEL